MSSQSLYRKWRPQTFDSLKGQDVIRDTLYYALTHNQLSQAYLFCGPRGTGKTTTARLIAKLINCTATTEPKPCNTCASCISITDGANLDILELDAASNRGIDEIRQLRDTVRFTPTQAKYKVFIIDEVHMLTREAFNALLKTLEEPPAHAIFILATTEAHKIPPTITSRCQRYDFRLATRDTLTEHLQAVAKAEGLDLQPEAAHFLARLGTGSFRDALSLLDQVKASHLTTYDVATIETLFGYVPSEQIQEVFQAILDGQTKSAHQAVDAILARGADLRAFCEQLLSVSQDALEGLILGDLSGFTPDCRATIATTGLARLVTWIEALIDATNQMKISPLPRLPLDVAIAKTSKQQAASSQKTERKTAEESVTTGTPIAVDVIEQVTPELSTPSVHGTVSVPVAVLVPDAIITEDWQRVLQSLKAEAPSLVTSLSHGKVLQIDGDVLKFAVRYKMHSEKINQPKNRTKIEQVLQEVLQVPLKIEAEVVKDLGDDEAVDLTQVFEFEE